MIRFLKIKRENIFGDEFINFEENNLLEFGDKNIIVLYGPNGTGKTSLAKILSNDIGCEYSLAYNDNIHTHETDELFHIIQDQNGRNLIVGETKDFLLGDDIRHEYELKKRIDEAFDNLFKNVLVSKLKNDFRIKKRNSKLTEFVDDENIQSYISDIANTRSKGSQIERNEFVNYINGLELHEIEEVEDSKCMFLINEFENVNSVASKILLLTNGSLEHNNNIKKIERHSEAIRILSKFKDVDECVVCDGFINVEDKLRDKTESKERVYNSLQQSTRDILDSLLKIVDDNDSFNLKNEIVRSINNGDFSIIEAVQNDMLYHLSILCKRIINTFIESTANTQLVRDLQEYNRLIESRPELTDEDIIFIENIVSDNIDKMIELKRDENNTLRLVLDGDEFLNKDRQKLRLSNGEQNFISLAFELLKAKNVENEIIILDDPISSFDSIYKNKIAFSIVKFLEAKKQIILTHNVELIRLIEHQKQNCYQLYIFNNTPDEANGFFNVNRNEKDMLLYMNKLVYLFRQNLVDEIENEELFLMSMVPFMRGYAQMICDDMNKNKLTSLMHGYKDEPQYLVDVYLALFGNEMVFNRTHTISAQDIINIDVDNIKIFKANTQYNLLEKTLKHTLTYLYLRLNVEKTLVDKFNINTNRYGMLSQIIFRSFRGNDLESKRKRIFLASKKTLLNEFNHFEGNMNIFQPAIDITNNALDKEKQEILQFLSDL